MLEIEIVNTEIIEGGVSVYARAWRDGQQIGFGVDGTVDIERFRIFNPPVLVPDPLGNVERIVENKNPDTGVVESTTSLFYREDPTEAILQVIEQSIDVMKNIHPPTNIIAGKIGKTTSTFYPDAHPETNTVDGFISYFDAGSMSWATLIAQATGTAFVDNTATDALRIRGVGSGGFLTTARDCRRGFFLFNTAAIGTDTIISATQSFYGYTGTVNTLGLQNGSEKLNITASSPASNTALALADYDAVSATKFSTDFDLGTTFANWSTTGYNNFAYNAAGITNINKTGITKTALRFVDDIEATTPEVSNTADSNAFLYLYFADQTGTTNDPKLVVEHTGGSVSVAAAAQVLTASIPAYSVLKGVTQSPIAQVITASIPAYVVSGKAVISPAAQSLVASIPPFVISSGGNITRAVATQSATFSIPAYTVSGKAVVSPLAQSATFNTPTPVITALRSIIISVATQILTFTLPALARVGSAQIWTKRARETTADWSRRQANDT